MLSDTDKKELLKKLSDKRNELREFRFGIAGSKIKDVKKSIKIKKEIAKILTKLNADKI